MKWICVACVLACGTPPKPTPPVRVVPAQPAIDPCKIDTIPTAVPALRELVDRCPAAPGDPRVGAAIVAAVLDPGQTAALATGTAQTSPDGEVPALAIAALRGGDPLVLAKLGETLEATRDVERAEAAYAQALAVALARNPGATAVPALASLPDWKLTMFSLVFSPDGASLAQSVAFPRGITVWNTVGDPRVLPKLSLPTWLSASTLAGITEAKMEVWDIERGSIIKTMTRDEGLAKHVDRGFEIAGNKLQIAGKKTAIDITGEARWAQAVMSADKQLLALSDERGVTLWNAQTGKLEHTVAGLRMVHPNLQFLEKSRKLLFAYSSGIKTLDLATSKATHAITGSGARAVAVWNESIAFASSYDGIHVVDLSTLKKIDTLKGHERQAITLSIGGRLLASAEDFGTVMLWDLATRKRVATLRKIPNQGRDDDWVILADDGRVEGSPDMRSKITWQVGTLALPGPVAWRARRTSGLFGKLVAP